ncbi:PIR protein [Plasmodium vivax]|uniref:VIR protein n=1 Tax=Plasmodium vivax TaxID=5855 RepID=A0A565A5K7_PLAVI|nr:PIR protein [Plasmodium vivax]
MAGDQKDPRYIGYQDYGEVKYQFDKTLKNNADEKRFENIIKYITNEQHQLYLNNDTLKKLHNVLSNDHALSSGMKRNYCSYINHWLNKEVQKTGNDVNESYFNIFKKFSEKLSIEKTKRKDQSCKDYFFDLGDKTINNMEFLYNMYDVYNQINSHSPDDKVKGCGKLELLSLNYRQSVYDYYVKNEDKDLYNKLEYIIGSIDQMTRIKTTSPCTQTIYFTKPRELENLLKEEAQKKADEEAAARKVQEETARQAKEKEDLEHQKSLQSKGLLSRTSDNELQERRHDNGDFHSTSYLTRSEGLVTSRLQIPTENFDSSEWRKSPKESLFAKGYTPPGQIEYTLEGRGQQSGLDQEQGDKGKTIPGTSFSSSGFPGYITEVLGSVEPGPVLGVSGGMGVLFLLFKYTPVGSFFGGRSGRFRQIPRSFGGFQPDFANFQDYDGGYIRYGPMSISSLAE